MFLFGHFAGGSAEERDFVMDTNNIVKKVFRIVCGHYRADGWLQNSTNQTKISELVRFSNSKSVDELNRLNEHVDRMEAVAK